MSPRREPYLFLRFPRLREALAWTPLGDFPTPVERLAGVGARLDHPHLFVKRDDLSAGTYGGNKVRKLEFTLADAARKGHGTVLTFGAAGSNHVLATTVHGRRLGLSTVAVLVDQPVQPGVRANLLADQAQGCAMVPAGTPLAAALRGVGQWLGPLVRGGREGRRRPYLLPPGGSSVLGALGYVEAALEIAAQVREGRLPAPSLVFVPVGTCGTLAGLVAGLALTDLPTRVVGVRVYGRSGANATVTVQLADRALALLRRLDPSVPERRVRATDFSLRDDWFGLGYARFTRRGMEAVGVAAEDEGLTLDGTYSGKAFAGFLEMMGAPARRGRPALFIDTYSSRPLAPLQEGAAGPGSLPARLRRYFEEPAAPIDDV